MRVVALCDADTSVGLKLAGIKEVITPDKNPDVVFRELTQQSDIAVLFITERIASELGRNLREYRLLHSLPLIVELPGKRGRVEGYTDFISYLIKRAVGVDIRLKSMEDKKT